MSPNLQFLIDNVPKHRIIALQGGARSSKTYSALQYLISLAVKFNGIGTISICRETFNALRASTMRDFFEVLNNQLLGPIGYEIRFDPEKLDVMQADEADRADSLLKLTQAGVALPDAMRILGYDNVDEMFLTPTTESPLAELPQEATQPAADIIAEPALLPDTKAMRQEHWGLLTKKLEQGMEILHWYEAELLKLYSQNKNLLAISRETKIPYRSLLKTIRKAKTLLKFN